MTAHYRPRIAMTRFFYKYWFQLAFVLIGASVISVGAISVVDLRRTHAEAQQMYAGSVRGLDLIGELQYQAQEARRSMLYSLTTTDSNLQVEYADQSRIADMRVDAMIREHQKHAPSSRALEAGRQLEQDWMAYLKIRDEVIASILEGAAREAVERDLRDGVPAFNRVGGDLRYIKQLFKEQAERRLTEVETVSTRSIRKLIIILCLTQLFAVLTVKAVQRGKMLQVVQQSEMRMREIIESINEGMFVIGQDGRVELWNGAAERSSGRQRNRVLGRPLTEAVPTLASTVLPAKIREARQSRQTGMQLDLSVPGDKQDRIFSARIFPFESGTTVFFDDVTARKVAEEQLRKLSQAVEQSPSIVMVTDIKGNIDYVNPKFSELTGYSSDEVIGTNPRFLKSDQTASEDYKELWDTITSGREWRGEFLNKKKHGELYWEFASISPIRNAQGTVTHFLAVKEDITQRKRAEAEVQQAKEAAEAANRAKSEFLANMSHEIRTPMNGIIGMTELALQTELNNEQREYLEMVKASSDSLMTVINDILDFSKIEAGKMDIHPIDFSLTGSLDETLKTLALRAHQKHLELICHVRPEVPDLLVGDPDRLRQVIVNLVGNAIKFTERGEVMVEVKLGDAGSLPSNSRTQGADLQDRRSLLHFLVRDTGIGIVPEKRRLIFDAFSQGDGSTTRKYGGTGLGLTISSRLVEAMGGQIWVESEPGRGSTFHFTASFGLTDTSNAKPLINQPIALRSLRVLVVDDNATNRRILKEVLSRWGMLPTALGDGRSASAIMKQARDAGDPFPLVLLDVHMPHLDGFAVAEQINADAQEGTPSDAKPKIIVLTSAGLRGDSARCKELGIAGYLTKPIRQSELLDTILTVLGTPASISERSPLITRHSIREGYRRLRILLAEDNAINQKLVVRMLQKQGHSVILAGNGREAFQAVSCERFDLVLMDVQMPEMNGLEAATAIRTYELRVANGEVTPDPSSSFGHRHPLVGRIPIIAMTAHAMKGDRERCLQAGMDSYISKPIQTDELLAVIAPLISGAEVAQPSR